MCEDCLKKDEEIERLEDELDSIEKSVCFLQKEVDDLKLALYDFDI